MSTKWESYLKTIPVMPAAQQKILQAVFNHPQSSRAELAMYSGMRLSAVCGRVNELLDKGMIRVFGRKFDAETSRNVETLVIVDPNPQGSLF